MAFTRVTAKTVREQLLKNKKLRDKVPCRQTVGALLNRMGYSLKRVQKTHPGKRFRKQDAIFDNVQASRRRARNEPHTLRTSLGTKAKVKVCEFSREGSARTASAIRAPDHDIKPDALLVPFGILELTRGSRDIHQPWFAFGHSKSDGRLHGRRH